MTIFYDYNPAFSAYLKYYKINFKYAIIERQPFNPTSYFGGYLRRVGGRTGEMK